MYNLIRDFKKSDVRKFDHLYLVKKNILIISIEEKMLKLMYQTIFNFQNFVKQPQ